MFGRILLRNAVVTSSRILKLSDKSLVISAKTGSLQHTKYITSSTRFYSEKANVENVTVDFEYVKRATQNKNVLIIDVREPSEVKEHGTIPNSINIPLKHVTPILSTMSEEEFCKQYNKPKPLEDTEIIFYCMIGKRSGMAQQNAINLGYKNSKNYLGSFNDWASKI